jgi:Domain of unknown function (DUF6249)
MFCPVCGSEQSNQYCRSCGMDLRRVYSIVDKPGETKNPDISARDEIGRAIADKIREAKSAKELSKIVEDVLPSIEEFLETPEEKRMRRIRTGTVTAAIGLGAAVAFFTLGLLNNENGLFFVACLGLTVFLIGLGIMLNGWFFTIPQKQAKDQNSEAYLKTTAESLLNVAPKTSPQERLFPSPISEHTTHQLPDSELRVREGKLE